jgi:putative hemolysin
MLKLLHRLLSVFLLSFLFVFPAYGGHLVDRVVAVVNNDVITLSELENAGREFFERIKVQAPAAEVDSALIYCAAAGGEVVYHSHRTGGRYCSRPDTCPE